MRLFGAHMRHQRILMIGVAGGADAEQFSGARLGPIGADQQRAAQFAAIAQPDARRGAGRGEGLQRRFDEHDARIARRLQAVRLQHSRIDDRTQVRLADLGAIENHAAAAVRRSSAIPYAHAFIAEDPVRNYALPNTAFAQHAFGCAAERKDPQIPVGIGVRSGAGKRSATIAMRSGAQTPRAAARPARAAPGDACADDHEIEFAAHCRGTPRASFGIRPPAPVLSLDSADFAGGSTSKASSARLRRCRRTPSGVEKTRTSPSVKAMIARRSAALHAS